MNFEEILDHAIAMLQRRGRVTYRTSNGSSSSMMTPWKTSRSSFTANAWLRMKTAVCWSGWQKRARHPR